MMLKNINLDGKCGSCDRFKPIDGTARGECLCQPYGKDVVHDPKHPHRIVGRSNIKCTWYYKSPKTNADHIRSMTDEELVELIECLRCGRTVYARGTDLRAGRKVACAVCSVTEAGERRRKPKELGYEPKIDCRAYLDGRCVGLNEMLCKTRGKCKFYKSKNEGE